MPWKHSRKERIIISRIQGQTQGLKAGQTKRLTSFYSRKIPKNRVVGPELARDLADLSVEVGRQIGLLIDRTGTVQSVIVGDPRGLVLPDLGRLRGSVTRLNGLRLVHTHLTGEGLNQDDLNDLASLRFDLIAALMPGDGIPPSIEAAYLLPEGGKGENVARLRADHVAALDLDFEVFIQSIEEEIQRRQKDFREERGKDRALLISLSTAARAEAQDRLNELERLSETAGLRVADKLLYRPRQIKSAQVLSQERIRELNILALQTGADLLIFDQNLSPSQANKLTEQTELRIIDRTQLILDIFAQRAQTREGKLQVEMAQLNYLLPRLSQKNTSMSRLTGGIGARGPGETKLEINRRRVRDRISRLRKELDTVKVQRSLHRNQRARAGLPVVSIVGYTNAGKSTLLNNLTGSGVLAEDKLFATLDPTSRRLRFPRDRSIIITDTVGFIRDLPPDLIEAFAATLEELSSADLLIHLIDAGAPDLEQQVETVERLLAELDLAAAPILRVLNKTDLIDDQTVEVLCRRYEAVPIRARAPSTFPPLIEAIQARLGWTKY